jgi:hypothetical protein
MRLTFCSSDPKKDLMLCIHYHQGSVGTKAGLEGLAKRIALDPLSNINLKYSASKHDIRKLYKKVRQISRILNRTVENVLACDVETWKIPTVGMDVIAKTKFSALYIQWSRDSAVGIASR